MKGKGNEPDSDSGGKTAYQFVCRKIQLGALRNA